MSGLFSPGDVVECIDTPGYRPNDPIPCDEAVVGKIYRITSLTRGWDSVCRNCDGVTLKGMNPAPYKAYRADCFRKIDDEQIPEVLERLKSLPARVREGV